MFSKWIQTAKESANQFISAANTVIQETAQSIQEVTTDLSEKTNAYIRDNVVKTPEDCTFITSNIIAMGFPGNPQTRHLETNINNREAVAIFLETKYPKHYKLFNLTEEKYDPLIFDNQVVNYNFTGFSAPSLDILFRVCLDMEEWLSKDNENIAVVHCFDGTGRTMTICAAFLTWEGWFPNTSESLDVCLNRRGLPPAIMLPSQLRYLSYFDSILQGTHISSESLRLSRITISCLPAIQNNSCSACIEIFNHNHIVYSSYRKGSKTRGTVTPVVEGDPVVFKPDVILKGNVFLRCRHLNEDGSLKTLFRLQFHTGFIKLFKLEVNEKEVDASIELMKEMKIQLDFVPLEKIEDAMEMESEIETQLTRESPLWNEIIRRRGSEKEKEKKEGEEDSEMNVVNEEQEEKEIKEEERSGEVEMSADAMELESMLKSYDKDLNFDSTADDFAGEDFDLEEYENALSNTVDTTES